MSGISDMILELFEPTECQKRGYHRITHNNMRHGFKCPDCNVEDSCNCFGTVSMNHQRWRMM